MSESAAKASAFAVVHTRVVAGALGGRGAPSWGTATGARRAVGAQHVGYHRIA